MTREHLAHVVIRKCIAHNWVTFGDLPPIFQERMWGIGYWISAKTQKDDTPVLISKAGYQLLADGLKPTDADGQKASE